MNNLVTLNINNQPTTTSKIIADTFGKPHKDVLKAVRALEIPEDFNRRNFSPISYQDRLGRNYPAYEITRDGFTLLAMGFTGKKAMEWKIKYIAAFNALEESVKQNLTVPSLTQDREALKAIGGIVKKCAVVAVRDAVMDIMTAAEQPNFFREVSDDDLIRAIWGWYAGHHRKTVDSFRELNEENAELKRKLAVIKKTIN